MWDCRRSLCAMCLYWFKDRPKLKLSFSRSLNWFRDGIQRLSKTISSDAFCCLYVILYQFLNREIIKPFLFHIILSLSVFNGSYINLCIWMFSLLQRKQTENDRSQTALIGLSINPLPCIIVLRANIKSINFMSIEWR